MDLLFSFSYDVNINYFYVGLDLYNNNMVYVYKYIIEQGKFYECVRIIDLLLRNKY